MTQRIGRPLGRSWSATVALFLLASAASAVWPLPPYRIYPCDPVTNNGFCFACSAFSKDEAYQIRLAERSARSNPAFPTGPYGICVGFHDWCIKSPQLGAVQTQVLPGTHPGTRRVQFTVPYDFPNGYCMVQDSGDSCRASIWPIQILSTDAHLTRLVIYENNQFVYNAPAVFEIGLWLPTVEASCGAVHTYEVQITNLDGFPECASPASASTTVSVDLRDSTDPMCIPPDRRMCPFTGAGKPINVGSGDVSYTLPLFTIAQSPLALSMALSYHSGTPIYPSLVTSPISQGWTHPFAQTLRPADPYALTLYHITAEGFESDYEIQEDGSWAASSPGELRGTVAKDTATNRYLLKDLDGTITTFDVTSGLWLSTTDRWGNTIGGTYTGVALTAVTDSMGRQVALSYTSGRLTQITAPDGETWRLAYTGSNLTQIFDPLHGVSTPWLTLGYQPDHRAALRLLSEVRDESGALLEGHSYDTLDRGITSVSEAGRNNVTVEYDTPGQGKTRVTSTIDAVTTQASVFSLFYQKGRWLPSRIDGNCATCGGATADTQSFTYDGRNDLLTRTDGNGHVTSYQYNANGNVLSMTLAKGTPKERTTTYRYDYPPWPRFRSEIHEPSAAKPGAEKVVRMSWNGTGVPEAILTASESGYLQSSESTPTTYTSVTRFDARHRVISRDGPRTDVSDVTTIVYYPDNDSVTNRQGRIRQLTDAVGLATLYDDFDVFGTAKSITDTNGVVTARQTDAKGRRTSSTIKAVPSDSNETADYSTGHAFDGRDRLTETVLPRGNRLRYRYEDGTNRLIDMIRVDSPGNEIERRHLTLNTIGDILQEEEQACESPAPTCASWVTKRSEGYTYDVHNRLSQIRHATPAGSAVTYRYDANGFLRSIQDENHATPNTLHAYDTLDRLVSVTQTLASAPAGAVTTSYSYDVMDNLTSVTDPNGNVTSYAYDDFRRMQQQISPVSGMTTNAYDATGNLVSSTDARGATTTRSYDAANRPLSATSVLAGSPTEAVSYMYDDATAGSYGLGRLAGMTDPAGSVAYQYERRGLMRHESRTVLGDGYATSYRYDANGNRVGLTYPSGRSLTYGFDFADRPQTLTGIYNFGSTTYVSSTSYLPFGPAQSLTYSPGIVRSASYDTRYRLTGFAATNGATTLASYQYGLDAAGNISAINDTSRPDFSRSFAYDDLYRLTGANGGQGLWGTGTYSYDPLGNRLSLTLGQKTATYTYQSVGGATTSRLQSVVENGTTRTVQMDAAGNETGFGSAGFLYSARNYLDQGGGLRYLYSGNGLRVAQIGIATGPILTLQPKSAPLCPGASATLVVRATGSVTYQWQLLSGGTWQDIGGATAASLTVTPASMTSYRVNVSNGTSSTLSDIATITPTALGTEPQSGGLYGDLNRSGTVDSTDSFLLKEVLAGNATIGSGLVIASPSAIDLNGDGRIDAQDLSLLTKYVAGGITCLPQIPAPPSLSVTAGLSLRADARSQPQQSAPNPTQYFFYTPEKSLIEETAVKGGGGAPLPGVDYIWFGGYPVAQENIAPQTSRFTFTDHLGTPFLQTDLAGTATWRAEYEPFGTIFAMRSGDAFDQRLRFPGQEYDEQAPDREYNIFRWYRPASGRYSQPDPIGLRGGVNLYSYAKDNPALLTDPSGLKIQQCFRPLGGWLLGITIAGTASGWIIVQPPVPGVGWCPMHEYLFNTDLPPGQNSWGFDPRENRPERGNDMCWDIDEPLGSCVWKNAPLLFPNRGTYSFFTNNCQTSINAVIEYCRNCWRPATLFDDILPGLQLK